MATADLSPPRRRKTTESEAAMASQAVDMAITTTAEAGAKLLTGGGEPEGNGQAPEGEAPQYPSVKDLIVSTLTPEDVEKFNAEQGASLEQSAPEESETPADDDGGEIEMDEQALMEKAEALDRIVAQSEDVDRLGAKAANLAKKAKAAKNEWEASVEDLQKLIRASKEEFPLFGGRQETASRKAEPEEDPDDEPEDGGQADPREATGKAPQASQDATTGDGPIDSSSRASGDAPGASEAPSATGMHYPPGHPQADDSWRETPIRCLAEHGLGRRVIDRLKEAQILTMGALADWSKTKAMTDLPGIKEATAERIAEANVAFWAARMKQEGTAK